MCQVLFLKDVLFSERHVSKYAYRRETKLTLRYLIISLCSSRCNEVVQHRTDNLLINRVIHLGTKYDLG